MNRIYIQGLLEEHINNSFYRLEFISKDLSLNYNIYIQIHEDVRELLGQPVEISGKLLFKLKSNTTLKGLKHLDRIIPFVKVDAMGFIRLLTEGDTNDYYCSRKESW